MGSGRSRSAKGVSSNGRHESWSLRLYALCSLVKCCHCNRSHVGTKGAVPRGSRYVMISLGKGAVMLIMGAEDKAPGGERKLLRLSPGSLAHETAWHLFLSLDRGPLAFSNASIVLGSSCGLSKCTFRHMCRSSEPIKKGMKIVGYPATFGDCTTGQSDFGHILS